MLEAENNQSYFHDPLLEVEKFFQLGNAFGHSEVVNLIALLESEIFKIESVTGPSLRTQKYRVAIANLEQNLALIGSY